MEELGNMMNKLELYVPITNRTINRTSAYPINKSARGETIIE